MNIFPRIARALLGLSIGLFANNLYAANCVPDSTVTFSLTTDAAGIEHLYWIDTNSLHVCLSLYNGQTIAPTGLTYTDLTQSRGLPLAASPIATSFLGPNGPELYYIDQNSYITSVVNEGSGSELTGLGKVSIWPALAVTASVNSGNIRSITYAVDTDNSVDKYGTRKAVWRWDYNYNSGASTTTNLYSAYGRSTEHLETQVNNFADNNGRVYSTFDPEGQGHIHYISSVPFSGGYQHQDLMDDTSVGGVNVTTGGGIVSPNNPTCQASGIATSPAGAPRFVFIGKDGDLHLLTGTGTSWSKYDITHDSGSTGHLPTGCGKLAVAFAGYDYIVYESNNALAYIQRTGNVSAWYLGYGSNVITQSPLAATAIKNTSTVAAYFVANVTINGVSQTALLRTVLN